MPTNLEIACASIMGKRSRAAAHPRRESEQPMSNLGTRTTLTRDLVRECFREMDSYGCTREEVETLSGLSGNTIRPIVLDLLADGVIHETGTKRSTKSGYMAAVLRWGKAT